MLTACLAVQWLICSNSANMQVLLFSECSGTKGWLIRRMKLEMGAVTLLHCMLLHVKGSPDTRAWLPVQVASLEEECQDARLKCSELEAAVDALGVDAGPGSLAAKYADTVRRQALVQVRHARLARQLAAATTSEQALQVGPRETCTLELHWGYLSTVLQLATLTWSGRMCLPCRRSRARWLLRWPRCTPPSAAACRRPRGARVSWRGVCRRRCGPLTTLCLHRCDYTIAVPDMSAELGLPRGTEVWKDTGIVRARPCHQPHSLQCSPEAMRTTKLLKQHFVSVKLQPARWK